MKYLSEGIRILCLSSILCGGLLCGMIIQNLSRDKALFRMRIERENITLHVYPNLGRDNDENTIENLKASILNDRERGQRITDIVVPFTKQQVQRMEENFTRWITFPPCPAWKGNPSSENLNRVALDSSEFYQLHGNIGRNITLTLALSGPEDSEVKVRLENAYAALPKNVTSCFNYMQVHFAGLTGEADGYLQGSRNVFELMLNGTFGLKDPYYVFYMEPDVRPIRPNWLAALDATTRWPVPPFWVRGSLFRGKNRDAFWARHIALHINGNAIYNLKDPEFREFYFKEARPVFLAHQHTSAYDSDLYLYLLDWDRYNHTSTLAHKFVYTEMIHNLWHETYSLTEMALLHPGLYLPHGGSPKP